MVLSFGWRGLRGRWSGTGTMGGREMAVVTAFLGLAVACLVLVYTTVALLRFVVLLFLGLLVSFSLFGGDCNCCSSHTCIYVEVFVDR